MIQKKGVKKVSPIFWGLYQKVNCFKATSNSLTPFSAVHHIIFLLILNTQNIVLMMQLGSIVNFISKKVCTCFTYSNCTHCWSQIKRQNHMEETRKNGREEVDKRKPNPEETKSKQKKIS